MRYASWSGSFTFYVCHVARFHQTPGARNFRLVIINFTDKIWLISINIGSYLCKMVNFDTSSAKNYKKCIFIFLPSLVRIIIIYMTVFHMYRFCQPVERMFWFHEPIAYWTYVLNRVCLLDQFYYRWGISVSIEFNTLASFTAFLNHH